MNALALLFPPAQARIPAGGGATPPPRRELRRDHGAIQPPSALLHPPSARALRHMRHARVSWW